jgi:hypothetical membrane protein
MKSENKIKSRNILYQKIAGLLMVIAGIQFILMVSISETLYPGYNTAKYTLSSLAELPLQEPSATIFNTTVFIAGLLILISSYLIYKRMRNFISLHRKSTIFESFEGKIFPVLLGLLGIGAMGVGIFPGYTGNTHVIFAMACFIFGSLALLTSFTVLRDSWLKYIISVLGAVAFVDILLVIFMQDSNPFMALGVGGAERLIVYPVILGIIALGGYLSGSIPLASKQ